MRGVNTRGGYDMAKSFFDILNDFDCDPATRKQIINIYKEPFFVNPFETNEIFIKWCIEWENARKKLIKNFTA